jgi:NifU-like protein
MIDYYKRLGKGVPCTLIKQDVEICHCFQVSKSTIRDAVMRYQLREIEDVTNHTKAGGGCTSCHPDIQHIIDECWEEIEREGAGAPPGEVIEISGLPGNGDRVAQIREVLENDIARALRTDGGDIELVEIRGNEVHVRLIGACASCPSSQATIKGWVESQLHEHVSEDLEVIEVGK